MISFHFKHPYRSETTPPKSLSLLSTLYYSILQTCTVMPCRRCGAPRHNENGCRVPHNPAMSHPTLWTTVSHNLADRQRLENQWFAEKTRIQNRFDQHYWHQPINRTTLQQLALPNPPAGGAIPVAPAPMIHNHELTFAPKLLLRKAEKTTSAQRGLHHVIRPGFCNKKAHVVTNHFPITLPNRIWRYNIGGFPDPITRQQKKVLVL